MAVLATAVVAILTTLPVHAGGQAPPASVSAPSPAAEPEFVPGELIVRFRPGVGAARRAEVRADGNARLQRSLPLRGLELLRLEPGESVRAAAAAFERDAAVLYAEPNFYRELEAIPNDPRFGDLWGLHNTGQTVNTITGTADADIDAPEAWDTTTGSSSVTVGVVDSGVAYDHPDLAPNIWSNPGESANGIDDDGNGHIDDLRGWDFVGSDNQPRDFTGHGTHVAGTIGARGNDGQGVAGVNWRSGLLPLRACGAVAGCSSAAIVRAFAYAASKGARVINASFGSAGFSQMEQDVIEALSGTLFVAAAGNEGLDLDAPGVDRYPCEAPAANVICVGATSQGDGHASFSNFGATAVDLAAPGINIFSTRSVAETVFSEGFEADIGATWTTGGTNNTWARTNERARNGSFSLTDSPGANYLNDTSSFAQTTGSFSLAGKTDCAIVHETRVDNEFSDGLFLDVSPNAVNWFALRRLTGSTGGGFVPIETRIAGVSGEPSVYMRFRMLSDASVVGDGVHLDDVRVLCPALTYGANDFEIRHGTSMAAPHVTGTAALMWADTPGASAATVRQRLLDNVDVLPSLAGRNVTGGRVNAEKAVESAPPPVVATQSATEISGTAATLRGTVNPRGHATSYRFDYGTTTSYGLSTPVQDAGTLDGVVPVSARATGLAPNTTYLYRLVAIYSDGTVAGSDAEFTTGPLARPVVALASPTLITPRSATLNGTVDPRGFATTYHFEYGTTTSYGLSTPSASAGSGNGAQPVTGPLSALEPDTTYHFRLVATNADGTTVSADAQFTTPPLRAPAVALDAPTIARRSATLNGTVDPRGLATTFHFEYGTTASYGLSTPTESAGAGNGAQPVSADLTGLEPDTTYHYRLVATNADGTTVSADAQFTTLQLAPPGVTLDLPTMITPHSATLNALIDPSGLLTTYHFEYGTTTSYGLSTPSETAAGSAQLVSAQLSGLEPDTIYHYRLVATNEDGTTVSDDAQFRTLPLPVVAAQPATGISRTGATLHGTVNPRGLLTSYQFEYGTSTSYGLSTPSASAGAGNGAQPVSADLTGLESGTTYHYRLVATNANGTAESADAEFTTPVLPPVIASAPATAITSTTATANGTVDPRGLATDYQFEYGTTTSYGLSTPSDSAGAGNGPQPVSAQLSGLTPGTTYHYRLVATNADGKAVSADRVLTTAAAPPAGGGPPPVVPAIIPPALPPAAPITLIPPALPPVQPFSIIAPATLRLDRRGAVTIRLAFPAGTPAGTGRAELVRGGAATRIGSKSFATKPGQTVQVRIRLTKSGRRLVARRKRVNTTLRVTVQSQVQTKQIRLRPRRG